MRLLARASDRLRSGAASQDECLAAQWGRISLLESADRGSALAGLKSRKGEAARARERLQPLRQWSRISEESYRTYVGDRNHVRLHRLLELVRDGDRVLDVGMGFGYVTGILNRERRLGTYVGIDLKEQFRLAVLDMAAANDLDPDRWRLEVLDVTAVTEEWMGLHRPDVVLVLEVLEHLAEPLDALRALARTVPADSTIVFTVPIFGQLDGVWGHLSRFDRGRIQQLCREAGLTIHYVEPVFGTWTLVAASPSETPPERLRPLLASVAPLSRVQRRFARALPEAPRTGYSVRQVTVDATQDFSRPGDHPQRVRLDHRRIGAFCEVESGSAEEAEGGLRLPVQAPGVLRLQLSCLTPDAFERVVVIGLDAESRPCLRWIWDGTSISSEPLTHLLRPGRPSQHFRVDLDGDPASVVAVDVVIRARAATTARLRMHRAAYFQVAPPAGNGG